MKTLLRISYSISAPQTPSFPHTGPLWQFLKTVLTVGACDAHRSLTRCSIHITNNPSYSHSFGTITLTMFWRVFSILVSCEPTEISQRKSLMGRTLMFLLSGPKKVDATESLINAFSICYQWVFYIRINGIFSFVNSSMGQAVVPTQNIWV